MKILRKINKGLILTIIVLVTLIVYLIGVESQRNKEKSNIDTAVKEYVSLINKYVVIPSEAQKLYSSELTEQEQEKVAKDFEKVISEQLEKSKEELKKVMIDNDMAVDIQKKQLEDIIYSLNDQNMAIVIKLDKAVTKIKKYTFDDDQVTITFDSEAELETKYLEDNKELTNKRKQKYQDEVMTLQLVDGTWKVVYADLQYYVFNGLANTIAEVYNF